MDREELINELRNTIGEYLNSRGLDLIDLTCRYEGKNLVLRILADKPEGGINMGECACLNSEISKILDEKNILQERYLLEVSSPGLDRPLMTKKDFLRCINKSARFFLKEPIKNKNEWEGIIKDIDDDSVCVDIGAEVLKIPLSAIQKAKQIITITKF